MASTQLASRPSGATLIAGDLVLITTVADEIRAFQSKDGRPAGSMVLPGRLTGSPFLAPAGEHDSPPLLIVLTAAGQLQAIGKSVEPPNIPLDFWPGTRMPPETLGPVVRGPGTAD
jgi:hypothetical protein